MNSISLAFHGGVPTVFMTTGAGSIHEGKFCLTHECKSNPEIDEEAERLISEIEQWRKEAKRKLAKLKKQERARLER